MIKDLTIEKAIKIGISKGYRFNFPEDWYGGITSKDSTLIKKQ